MTKIDAKNQRTDTIIERDIRLSDSVIWRLQLEYYRDEGPAAWNKVPTWITNNPRLASLYAETSVAFALDSLADHGHPLCPDAPINIVELGAGSGALCFRVLRALDRLATVFNLGVCDLREKRWEEAIIWFERCLAEEPDYASALKYVDVARTLAEDEKRQEKERE